MTDLKYPMVDLFTGPIMMSLIHGYSCNHG
jgi:hypothetical protein